MNQEQSAFRTAIEQVCAGSEEAARHLIDDYGPHIQRVVRRKLNHQMRSKFDSEDFVQMVWISFFAEPTRIAQFEQPDELIRYLAGMAMNKLTQESGVVLRTKTQCLPRAVA